MALAVPRRRTVAATMQDREPVRALWGAEDVMRWFLAIGAGGVVIAVSWYVCAGDASFNRQIGPLDAAVAGLVVAGLGNGMLLLRGRRALGERRRALLPDTVPAAGVSTATVRKVSATRETSADVAEPAALFVAGEGMVRFHRATCALASGRSWGTATRLEHEQAGRLPCGVCRP